MTAIKKESNRIFAKGTYITATNKCFNRIDIVIKLKRDMNEAFGQPHRTNYWNVPENRLRTSKPGNFSDKLLGIHSKTYKFRESTLDEIKLLVDGELNAKLLLLNGGIRK